MIFARSLGGGVSHEHEQPGYLPFSPREKLFVDTGSLRVWAYVVGVSTEGMGVDTTLTLAGTIALATPLDRRAAMRRDRNLSAMCLGTSTDLIKLILAPWTAVN
jgi:hypothetical protein